MSITAQADIYCPHCGYNLRGLPSPRCPECGNAVDLAAAAPVIPWRHCQRIGRIRAYLTTVVLALFRVKRFKTEINAAPGYNDARRFWLITMAIAFLPFPVMTWLLTSRMDAFKMIFRGTFSIVSAAIAGNLGILLFMLTATAFPSFLCLSRQLSIGRQNRAIAMSYYASAAWLFMPLGPISLYLGAKFDLVILIIGFWIFPGIGLAIWYFNTLHILLLATKGQKRSGVSINTLLPLGWIALAVIFLAVFPFLIYDMLMLAHAW